MPRTLRDVAAISSWVPNRSFMIDLRMFLVVRKFCTSRFSDSILAFCELTSMELAPLLISLLCEEPSDLPWRSTIMLPVCSASTVSEPTASTAITTRADTIRLFILCDLRMLSASSLIFSRLERRRWTVFLTCA